MVYARPLRALFIGSSPCALIRWEMMGTDTRQLASAATYVHHSTTFHAPSTGDCAERDSGSSQVASNWI
ncbi:unnamed protein product [Toxocara canis]|uniref:Secreted protein n=1 Tax=Toxocara canis TaxID=6265 RepID=A0A183V2D7_TOXCA|nr:unnamed protein product [Toxocara canis]